MSDDEMINGTGEFASPADSLSAHDTGAAALGALTSDELAALHEAVATDPRLATEFAAMEETLGELGRVAPQRQINRGRAAGIRSRLVSRAAASPGGHTAVTRAPVELAKTRPVVTPAASTTISTAASVPASTTPSIPSSVTSRSANATVGTAAATAANARAGRFATMLALAASLIVAIMGVQLVRVTRERNTLRTAASGREATFGTEVADLRAAVASKDSALASLTGPNVRVINLVNYASSDPVARMFWDRKTNQWTMRAYNLRRPRPGKIFQLWLLTTTSPNPISAGTFTPDASGAAVVHATYALDRNALDRVAVSEEPEGGVPSPTGPILIAGR